VVSVVCAAKGFGSPYLVLFGSTREGSDPVRCRHAWESLGESPLRGRPIQHSRCAQRAGGSTASPRKKGGTVCQSHVRAMEVALEVDKDSPSGWRGSKLAAKGSVVAVPFV